MYRSDGVNTLVCKDSGDKVRAPHAISELVVGCVEKLAVRDLRGYGCCLGGVDGD